MNIACTACGASLSVPESANGTTVRCPNCQATFSIGDLGAATEPMQFWQPAFTRSRKTFVAITIALAAIVLFGCPCSGLLIWRVFFHRSPSQRMLDNWAENLERLDEGAKLKKSIEVEPELAQTKQAKEEDAIMNHKWWRHELTVAELDKLVDFIIDTDAGYSVVVEDDLRMTRLDDVYRNALRQIPYGPDARNVIGAKTDWFIVDISGKKRVDRSAACDRILAALDRIELVTGPGRGPKARPQLQQREGPGALDQWKNARQDLPKGKLGPIPTRPASKDR